MEGPGSPHLERKMGRDHSFPAVALTFTLALQPRGLLIGRSLFVLFLFDRAAAIAWSATLLSRHFAAWP